VLEEIKRDSTLTSIPVFVLTTSASEQDVQRSYLHHANCFITKPVGLEGFFTVVNSIDSFWLSVVKLPTREAQGRESRPGVERDPGDARLSLSE
jgi:chemotaxis family two-component system response regulator Rcp1